MPNSGWDNGAPAPKKGLSIWGKVAIGCGAGFLCFVLAVGALVGWGVRKATSTLDRGWAELHADVESLRTEAGAQALYRANPGLAQPYPTEADFLQAAALWRPKLGEVPRQRPELKALFRDGSFRINSHQVDGKRLTSVNMRMSTGATLVVETENEKLTDLRVE